MRRAYQSLERAAGRAAPSRPAHRASTRNQAIGNQARLRAFSATQPGFQAKLAIGAVDDPLEREADAIADRVTRLTDPVAAPAASPVLARESVIDEDEHKKVLHPKLASAGDGATAEAPPIVHDVLGAPGRPLDPDTAAVMGDRFGTDFTDVRIHTDGRAAESAAAVNAHAYTVGRDIVFGAGRYDPKGETGQRLLAHELTHTVQQGGAPVLAQRDGPDVPLKEAKKEDAKDAIGGGLKEAADQFTKDDKIKDLGTGLLKTYAEPIWTGASTPDKIALVAGGLGLAGIPLAALASNPNGRQVLSGVPLGKALSLVPYAVIDDGKFDLPKAPTDPLLIHVTLKADDYLDLLRKKYDFLPKMTFSYELTLAVSPDHKISLPYGLAKFSPTPGVTLAGGYGVTPDLPTLAGQPGGPVAPYKALPTPATPAPPAGVGAFVAVDLTKIGPLKSILAPVVGDVPDKK
jgi:hypothetical protein